MKVQYYVHKAVPLEAFANQESAIAIKIILMKTALNVIFPLKVKLFQDATPLSIGIQSYDIVPG